MFDSIYGWYVSRLATGGSERPSQAKMAHRPLAVPYGLSVQFDCFIE